MRIYYVVFSFLLCVPLLGDSDSQAIIKDCIMERNGCEDLGITIANQESKNIKACAVTLSKPQRSTFSLNFNEFIKKGLDKIFRPYKQEEVFKKRGRYLVGLFKGYGPHADTIVSYVQVILSDYLKNFFALITQTIGIQDMYALSNFLHSQLAHYSWAKESYATACFCFLEGPCKGFKRIPLHEGGSYTYQERKNGYKEISAIFYKAIFTDMGKDCYAFVIRNNQIVFSTHEQSITSLTHEKFHNDKLFCWGNYTNAHHNQEMRMMPDVYLLGFAVLPSNDFLESYENTYYLKPNDILVFATEQVKQCIDDESLAECIKKGQVQGKHLQIISDEIVEEIKNTYSKNSESLNKDISLLIVKL